MSLELLRRRKKARADLERMLSHPDTALVVHYSCESFDDRPDGKSQRITSIAARNLASGQTQSFSIHQVAELQHVEFSQIELQYDVLERKMLDSFFEFVRTHAGHQWIHWNMRDINYGFIALEHRYAVLGGSPCKIDEANKFDLARCAIDLYGYNYANHPRLENVITINGIGSRGFLVGAKEAEAFKAKRYVELHQSTLRKVDILSNIATRIHDKTLKFQRDRSYLSIYPAALVDLAKDHWLVVAVGLLTTILSAFGSFQSGIQWILDRTR